MQQCLLGNQELMPVIGNFPISTLAAFPGLGLSHAVVHGLIDQVSARDEKRRSHRRVGVMPPWWPALTALPRTKPPPEFTPPVT